jgi:uncharacterized protein YbaR (Trm112 family)
VEDAVHILLTDLTTCPRCGPEFGLIALADSLVDRRIRAGSLGCANCRSQYPVRGGIADLRVDGGAALAEDSRPGDSGGDTPEPDDSETAFRIAALLGVSEGGGALLLVGFPAALVIAASKVVPEVEFALLDPPRAEPAARGISQLLAGPVIPLRSRSVRGVALQGDRAATLLPEALRVLRPGARLVVVGAAAAIVSELRATTMQILLDQDAVVVASLPPLG